MPGSSGGARPQLLPQPQLLHRGQIWSLSLDPAGSGGSGIPLPISLSLPLFMSLTLLSLPFVDPDDNDKSGRTTVADLGKRRVDLGGRRMNLGDSKS